MRFTRKVATKGLWMTGSKQSGRYFNEQIRPPLDESLLPSSYHLLLVLEKSHLDHLALNLEMGAPGRFVERHQHVGPIPGILYAKWGVPPFVPLVQTGEESRFLNTVECRTPLR